MQQHGSKCFARRRPLPRPRGVGSKGQILFFSEHGHVAYQINEIANAATCNPIFCPYTHPRPLGWGQMSKLFFYSESKVAYQIRREWSIEHNAST